MPRVIPVIMKTKLLLLLFTLFICLFAKGQDISFLHLTTDDGLSHNSVISIYQDERGFLWFGTRNGVSLYNGKDFRIFKKEKGNKNSLRYNNIYQVIGDRRGHVYLIGIMGVSEYDIKTDTFTHLTMNGMFSAFYADHLYTADGYHIYKYEDGQLSLFYQVPDHRFRISCFHIHNDSILIGTSGKGLYLLTPERELRPLLPHGHISDILRTRSGDYWVADRSGGGVYRLHQGEVTHFMKEEGNPYSLSANFVHRCCEDQEGNIWIGTFNGLNRFNPKDGTFSHYDHSDKKKSLSHSSVWSLACDSQGNMWVGTYFGGVNYFHPQKQVYQEYQPSAHEGIGLSSPIVSRICEGKDGILWISTEGGGLNRYDPKTGRYQWYKEGKFQLLSQSNIRSMYYDSEQEILWMGMHLGGLNKLDLKTAKVTSYRHVAGDSTTIPSNIVEDVLPYQGKLILATTNNLALFDPKSGKSQLLLDNPDARYVTTSTVGLMLDHQGNLWITNNINGISVYHFDTKQMDNYKVNYAIKGGISSNSINTIYEDSQHRIWICTNDEGLDLYQPDSKCFENFDMKNNGLNSNVVYNACELSDNRLLITTDLGFSILDCQTKRFTNYDNLPLSCINPQALFRNGRGEIFIGGTDGMVSFSENVWQSEHRSYRILPYRLTVNGQVVHVGGSDGILTQDISYTPSITLKANQNLFNIEYTTTDFVPFGKDKIIYRMEGFSESWNRLKQHTITYTNLNPGTYTLIVKAEGVDEALVPASRLEIKILPPFYRTNVAYLIYLITIGSLMWFLVRTYYRRIQLQESLKYEQNHIRDIEQLNQSKLRFFTNISHEFRTPLTLIIGQMEMLLQIRSLTPNVYGKMLSVYKNSLQMKALISELLDFRKQEQGYMSIKVSEHNIVEFVYELFLLFQEHAEQRNIAFTFDKSGEDIRLWFDAKQMQKVLNNLISNAFKYTPKGGRISIAVRKWAQEVIIEVADNGVGIKAEDIDKIFNRFYQIDNDSYINTGTGIGLALTKGLVELHHGSIEVQSEPKQGSVFRVHLPMGNEHFTEEQICRDSSEIHVLRPEKIEEESLQTLLQEQELGREDKGDQNHRHKILIVEDNRELNDMLSGIFSQLYMVINAYDGKEGIEKARSEMPDIILSDVIMPEVTGTELCRTLKNDFDTCHIPVVLLTAKTAIEHNLEGLRMGADDYISKPFNVNILLSRCNNLVKSRMMLQEKYSRQPQADLSILATNAMDKQFVDQVMEIVERRMEDSEFNVDELALTLCMSRTKFFTKFKAITGQTPREFVTDFRLKRAAFLLRNHLELNMAEISDRVGYINPKYFSKCFKEKYHVTPMDYRRQEESESE